MQKVLENGMAKIDNMNTWNNIIKNMKDVGLEKSGINGKENVIAFMLHE